MIRSVELCVTYYCPQEPADAIRAPPSPPERPAAARSRPAAGLTFVTGHRQSQARRGGLLGLLLGDALGVPYEFRPAGALPAPALIDMTPPPGFARSHAGVPPGTWSDDGAQALCLAESLLARDALDLDDFGRRLLRWRDRGHLAVDARVFDVGIQTGAALARLRRGMPPDRSGDTGANANGNGSLMRVLPLALWHRGEDAALVALARRQSLVTHGHLRAQLCCALLSLVARRLLQGRAAGAAWHDAADTLRALCAPDPEASRELASQILGSPLRDAPAGSGYVVDTLWSARQCQLRAVDFTDAVRRAVALGDDTDTTAAVTGGLAGIVAGESGLPPRWVGQLRGRPLADPLLDALGRLRP